MRSIVAAGMLAGVAFLASPAFAGSETEDRSAAIAACRTAIAAEAGVPADAAHVDFHRSQTRPGVIEARFRVRSGGESWDAQCDYRRRAGEVASVRQDRPEALAQRTAQAN